MPVAVVTDSTSYLPSSMAGRVTVVPLTVVIDGVAGAEGEEVSPAAVATALAGRSVPVSTSLPSPERFVRTYQRLLAEGADGVVSVHLSSDLSGTYEAASRAAAEVDPARVRVVDSRLTAMGLGFCALAAADVAGRGADLAATAAAATAAAATTTAYFYVDTLEHLRRGGRIGAASAMLGTALSVKPILEMADGVIVVRDKVRTASRALARLVDLAAAAAGERTVDIAVQHLAAAERAGAVRETLTARLGDRLRRGWVSEVGAVVAAHTGPGLVGVVVHQLPGASVNSPNTTPEA